MLVNDRVENIGTSECRLSSELYECGLKAMRGVAVILHFTKPTYICSRVSHVEIASPAIENVHNSYSARKILC